VRLGNPQLAKAAKRGVAALRANARQFAVNVLPIIEEIERAGITSHNAIAAKLNERNVRTARGGKWTHVQVGAVLRPFEQARGRRRRLAWTLAFEHHEDRTPTHGYAATREAAMGRWRRVGGNDAFPEPNHATIDRNPQYAHRKRRPAPAGRHLETRGTTWNQCLSTARPSCGMSGLNLLPCSGISPGRVCSLAQSLALFS
jgi:hypothetical protein